MIVYMDSSSLVPLYVEEPGRTSVVKGLRDAPENTLTTSRVAYAEVRAALARRRAERSFASEAEYPQAIRDFNRDWRRTVLRVNVTETLLRLAGDLAERYILRGYDSLHLASALALHKRIPGRVLFSSWDNVLVQAALTEGLELAHWERP